IVSGIPRPLSRTRISKAFPSFLASTVIVPSGPGVASQALRIRLKKTRSNFRESNMPSRSSGVTRTTREFRNSRVVLVTPEDLEGMFDSRKLERVFFNLILNACEATPGPDGTITVDARKDGNAFEIRVRDNGRGIPDTIRDTLFDAFVSFGKTDR